MAILIKNPEVERLARHLAAARGITLTALFHNALREQAFPSPKPQGKKMPAAQRKEIEAIIRRAQSLPVRPGFEGDYNDWMYDENGLPK